MKVKELIAELQKYPNQEAELNIIANIIDADEEAFGIEKCHIECAQQDIKDAPIYDIYVYRNKNDASENANTISNCVRNSDWVSIEIDNDDQTIEIRDEYGIVKIISFYTSGEKSYENAIAKLLSLI